MGRVAPLMVLGLWEVLVHAQAQPYPSKVVRVIVPWPGGSNDAAARLVFQKIAESWGQPAVIDNRSGASGTIGAALVARSAPDGYTVMVTSASIATNTQSARSSGCKVAL